MRYLILLWEDSEAVAALSAEERRAIVDAHLELSRRLREDGRLVLGEPLDDATHAKVVRAGIVSDGPFVETKEQLGGFYLVDVESEEEAVDIARSAPASPGLAAEVRRVPEL